MLVLLGLTSSVTRQMRATKAQIAYFIRKLTIFALIVSASGFVSGIIRAPFWKSNSEAGLLTNTSGILIDESVLFVFWVTMQWSTWVIAFQIYSNAKTMRRVDEHFERQMNQEQDLNEDERLERKKKNFLSVSTSKLIAVITFKKEEREENSPLQDTVAFEEEVRKQNERLDCVAKMGVVLTFFTQGAQIVSMTVYRLLS